MEARTVEPDVELRVLQPVLGHEHEETVQGKRPEKIAKLHSLREEIAQEERVHLVGRSRYFSIRGCSPWRCTALAEVGAAEVCAHHVRHHSRRELNKNVLMRENNEHRGLTSRLRT